MEKEYFVNGKAHYFQVSEKRQKVWDCELGIIQELERICKKYNLTYFLDAGSLLGAVRHKGFIPWDDDIDLLMPRKDYDKLIEVAGEEIKYPYFLQHITTDPKYPGLHVKIRDSRTTAIIKSWLFTDVNQGIFIDIFPLEGLPNDKNEADVLYRKASVMGRAIKSFYNFDKILSLNPRIIMMLLKRRRIAKSLITDSDDYVRQYLEFEQMFKDIDYDACNFVGPLSFNFANERVFKFPRECFSEAVYVDFENIKLPVPKDYDPVLKAYFGDDYMTPKLFPSEHGSAYYDTEKSYTHYLPLLRREYSLFNRVFRAIKSLFTKDSLSALEKELYRL